MVGNKTISMGRSQSGFRLPAGRFRVVLLLLLSGASAAFSQMTAPAPEPSDRGTILLESAAVTEADRAPRLGGAGKLAANLDAALGALSRSRQATNYYLVRVKGPHVAEIKARLEAAGGQVMGYAQYDAFIVRMDAAALGRAQALEGVEWIGAYQAGHRVANRLRERMAGAKTGAAPEPAGGLTLDVYLFSRAGADEVVAAVERLGGAVVEQSRDGTTPKLRVKLAADQVEALSALPEIRMIHEFVPETTENDVGAGIMGAPAVWNTHGLTGTNQVVGHADTGLDVGNLASLNPDFRGRVTAFALGRAASNDWSDFRGHGTHTAGSILGNGANSGGQFKGLAYEASLVHQSISDISGGLGGLPADYGTMLTQAYTNGARLHSDSWGSALAGAYSRAVEFDAWAWNGGSIRDLLIVVSAGNSGPNATTVGSPGTAKNALTVGASENFRPGCGADGDNTNQMATFSSRGPTVGGRVKPDLVAPGTWVVSARTHAVKVHFSADAETLPDGFTEEGATAPRATPWTRSTDYAHSGSWSWQYATNAGTFDDHLVAPAITFTNTGAPVVYITASFRGSLGASTYAYWAYRVLGRSTTNWGYSNPFFGTTNLAAWTRKTLSLSGVSNQVVQIAINVYGTAGGSSANFFVDDLSYSSLGDYSGFLSDKGLAQLGDATDMDYILCSGTSMSTPLTCGAAALTRQFYQERQGIAAPSAALIKATLINGATDMTPATPRPDFQEGWGRLNLENALYPAAPRVMRPYDETNGVAETAVQTRYLTVTDTNESLKVTLVWTDRQGDTLQNDLDLNITAPNGTVYASTDHVNNVEGRDVAAPVAGRWRIDVEGQTVPYGPQPYALIVSGAVTDNVPPRVGLTGASQELNGSGQVTISDTVFDLDGDPLNLEASFSTNSGATWNACWMISAVTEWGVCALSNDGPFQLYGIPTAGVDGPATNRNYLGWDSKHEPAIAVCTDTLVRLRGWDGTAWSAAVTSAPFAVDNVAPTCTISRVSDSPTQARSVQFALAFSEDVAGLEAGDLTLAGTAPGLGLTDFAGGPASYAITAVVTGTGRVTLAVGAGVCADAAGNPNLAAEAVAYEVDTQRIVVSRSPVAVPEGGATGLTARLNFKPAADVTVSIARASGDTNLTLASAASLRFTPLNWSQPQAVTLAAAEDPDADPGEAVFTLSAGGMEDVSLSAIEADDDYVLSLSGESGSVVPSPARIAYEPGSMVSVRATPVAGYHFAGWAGDAEGFANPLAVAMTNHLSIKGLFALNVITVVTDRASVEVPEGGTNVFRVRLGDQPTGVTAVAVARTAGDDDLTVQAGASLFFTTGNWSNYQAVTLAAAEDDGDNGAGAATFTCSGGDLAAGVEVTEADDDYQLIVPFSEFGDIAVIPMSLLYDRGTTVQLTATPRASYFFSRWLGDATGSVNPKSVVMNADKSISAEFLPGSPVILPPRAVGAKTFKARWRWAENGSPEGELNVFDKVNNLPRNVAGYAAFPVLNGTECAVAGLLSNHDYWYRIRRVLPDGTPGPWSGQMKVRTGRGLPVFTGLVSGVPVSKGIIQELAVSNLVTGSGQLKVKSSNTNAVRPSLAPAAVRLQYVWKKSTNATVTLRLAKAGAPTVSYKALITKAGGPVVVVSNSALVEVGGTMEQEVTLENLTGGRVYGLRVMPAGLERNGWLLNRTGLDPATATAMREIPCLFPKGDRMTVTFVYAPAVTNQPAARPIVYKAWAILPPMTAAEPADIEEEVSSRSLVDGLWLLGVPASINRLYEVYHSDDEGATWSLNGPAVRATGNYLMWLDADDAAPFSRLYRVTALGL